MTKIIIICMSIRRVHIRALAMCPMIFMGMVHTIRMAWTGANVTDLKASPAPGEQ